MSIRTLLSAIVIIADDEILANGNIVVDGVNATAKNGRLSFTMSKDVTLTAAPTAVDNLYTVTFGEGITIYKGTNTTGEKIASGTALTKGTDIYVDVRMAILDGAVLPPPRGPLVLLLLTRLCRFGLLTMCIFAVAENPER